MTFPVLTFLSRSPAASRKTLALLGQLGAMEPLLLDHSSSSTINNNISQHDELDELFPSSLLQWDSAASKCRRTGTILHLISIQNKNHHDHHNDTHEQGQNLSLLSITPSSVSKDANESLSLARHTLAFHIKEHYDSYSLPLLQYWKNAFQLATWNKFGKDISTQLIFGRKHNGLPILQFSNDPDMYPNNNDNRNIVTEGQLDSDKRMINDSCRVREIVLPHRHDARYAHSGSCLLQELANHMHRPKTGLYQWKNNATDQNQNEMNLNNQNNAKNGIIFRPLPDSQQDMMLSSPTLVFSCPTFHDIMDRTVETNKDYDSKNNTIDKSKNNNVFDHNIQFEKIGFNGNRNGQLLARHKSLIGLDIRFCESKVLSSTFAESQESLMAGSLDELQSAHVMLEGENNKNKNNNNAHDNHQNNISKKESKNDNNYDTTVRSDAMNGTGDCWVEFRANIKRPVGFLKNWYGNSTINTSLTQHLTRNNSIAKRTAKAPNIPFQ